MTTRLRVRPIAGWAGATMIAIATCALTFIWQALEPLVDAGAAADPPGWVGALGVAAQGAFLGTFGCAATLFLVWFNKARANVKVLRGGRFTLRDGLAVLVWFIPVTNLVLPLLQTTDLATASAGRDARSRRHLTTLVGLWWGANVATLLAWSGAVYFGRPYRREIGDLRTAVAHGRAVDAGLASDLFGAQVARMLPAIVLMVLAAVLALLLVTRVTGAQYARVARLRGQQSVARRPVLRSTADDWTVVLPASAVIKVDEADGEATVVVSAGNGYPAA